MHAQSIMLVLLFISFLCHLYSMIAQCVLNLNSSLRRHVETCSKFDFRNRLELVDSGVALSFLIFLFHATETYIRPCHYQSTIKELNNSFFFNFCHLYFLSYDALFIFYHMMRSIDMFQLVRFLILNSRLHDFTIFNIFSCWRNLYVHSLSSSTMKYYIDSFYSSNESNFDEMYYACIRVFITEVE